MKTSSSIYPKKRAFYENFRIILAVYYFSRLRQLFELLMMSKTILIFSLLTITSALLHAQKVVYNQNGLSLQIRATLTKSYRHATIQGQAEDRYIWQVDARLANANAVPVNLRGFYIKRTVKCFEGSGDPNQANCKMGTVLENMPVVLPAKDSKLISGCFDTNCSENLDIDWWISDWVLKSGTAPKNIPGQNGLSTFESASSNGFDPATWAVMNEAKKLYEKVNAETPHFVKLGDDPFSIYRYLEWFKLLNYARIAEQDRRWALVAHKNGSLPCVKYHILDLRAALISNKAYIDFLEAINWEKPSALNNSREFIDENMEKYFYSKQRSDRDPLLAEAKKILEEVQECPLNHNILDEWNEADYAPSGRPGSGINPFVEPQDTSSPSSPDVADTQAQQADNTSQTGYSANNSARKDTPSQQSNPKADFSIGEQVSSTVASSAQPNNSASPSSSGSTDKSASTVYTTNFKAALQASNKNDYRKVIDYLTTAIKAQPDSPDAYFLRGNTYGYLNQYNEVIADYDKAESQGNRTANLYEWRAATHKILHKNDDALADYTQAISAAPLEKKASYYTFRGKFYEKLGQPANAFEDYIQALRLDPNNLTANHSVSIGYSLPNQSNHTATLASADSVVSISIAHNALVLDAIEASIKGEHSKALTYLNKAIMAQPSWPDAYFQRASLYRELKQYKQSLSDFNKVESLGRHDEILYTSRADLNKILHRNDDALADYTKAILVAPLENTETYYTRSVAYQTRAQFYEYLGQLLNALEDYTQALGLEPDNHDAAREVKRLKNRLNTMSPKKR
ncbi:hypothetical protein GCM10027299_58610 [Larkinella ripae]